MSFPPPVPTIEGDKIETTGSHLKRQRHPWVRTGDGRYERTTTGQERWFGLVNAFSQSIANGREADSIRLTVRFTPPPGLSEQDLLARLREAWVQCRFQHPSVACAFVEGSKILYTVPGTNDTTAQSWVDESFIISKEPDARTAFATLPTAHITDLIYFPASREIMFRAPHACIDAKGGLIVLDSIFKHLSQTGSAEGLAWGEEVFRLPYATTDALDCTPADKVSEQDKEAYFALEGKYFAGVPAPVGPAVSYAPGKPPGTPAVAYLDFTQDETKRIVQGSKAKGFRTTAAVHSAYVLALIRGSAYPLKGKDGAELSSYSFPLVFDHRQHFPSLAQPEHAVGLGSGPWLCTVPLGSPPEQTAFDDVAAYLAELYTTTFQGGPGSDGAKRRKFNEFYFERLCALFTSPQAADFPKAPEAAVSSLGLVDGALNAAYGAWQLHDFGLCVDVTIQLCALHVWTFLGQMKMAYSYNDAYWKASDIQAILDLTKEILLQQFP